VLQDSLFLFSGDSICLVADSHPDGCRGLPGASAERCAALQSSHLISYKAHSCSDSSLTGLYPTSNTEEQEPLSLSLSPFSVFTPFSATANSDHPKSPEKMMNCLYSCSLFPLFLLNVK